MLVMGPIGAGAGPFVIAGIVAAVVLWVWAYFAGWIGPHRK